MIAAGEVVENPASAVKELVENSIDAGATQITIDISQGGTGKIEVTDNGCGIEADEIVLAFTEHATSKVHSQQDLHAIGTLGFRGEALASIACVSEVELTTKTASATTGTKVKLTNGEIVEKAECAFGQGTKIVVRNLFYNTPARKKFLSSPKVEENAVTRLVERFMLSYPQIKFKYIADQKTIYSTLGTNLFDNIYLIYGKEVTDNLLEVNFCEGDYVLEGYVSNTSLTKPNRSYQISFLNGRMVKDLYMENAIQFAYDDYLMRGQFPVCFLNLKMPFDAVDVNIHPSKQEVKYENPRAVNLFFIHALKDVLERSNSKKFTDMFKTLANETPDSFENSKFAIAQNFKSRMANLTERGFGTSYNKQETATLNAESAPLQEVDLTNLIQPEFHAPLNLPNTQSFLGQDDIEDLSDDKQQQLKIMDFKDDTPYKLIGTAYKTYIFLELENKILVVDQHACHERIIYDKLIKELESKQVHYQKLLYPYTFKCNADETLFFNEHLQDFAGIGIIMEEFGQNMFRITQTPALVRDIEFKDFVLAVKSQLNRYHFSQKDLLKDFLAKTACKAAVTAGDKLSDEEILALLKDLENNKTLVCPHGRPFVYEIKKSTVEKWFKRIL